MVYDNKAIARKRLSSIKEEECQLLDKILSRVAKMRALSQEGDRELKMHIRALEKEIQYLKKFVQ